MELLEFDILQSGVVILLLLSAGELLGRLCRGTVPGILLAGVLFVASCWSGLLPADLQQLAGLAQLTPVAILMTIASMGASMSLRQFAANWRVAAVAAMTYIGQVLAVFLVIGGLFGVNMAVGGLPGGMAAALIVQERARTLGYDQVIVLSVLVLTTQALIGCPVAAACIRPGGEASADTGGGRTGGDCGAVPPPSLEGCAVRRAAAAVYCGVGGIPAGNADGRFPLCAGTAYRSGAGKRGLSCKG